MPIIRFQDVWEMYRIKFIIEGKVSWQNFWALRGIDFSVETGETLGIIGENGAGKSTVLKLIAGMLNPDRGQVNVAGSVSGLLELGAGFQAELTGRDNILLQSELFGLCREEINKRYQQIIDFAEIGKFIDAPVKCYSQGMFVRLAFAIAVHMEPEIFLIDDSLAVGDEYFQRKCVKEIFKIKERGKAVVIVTHDMAMLEKLCKRTIFLKNGMMVGNGETSKTVSFYSQALGSPKGIAVIERKQLSVVFNNGRILLNWKGKLITPSSGVYTTFGISGAWYSSTQAEWNVEESNGRLVARGEFYHLGLSQIWRIEVGDNYEIKWEIEIETETDIQLSQIFANVMLVDGYKQWFVDLEQGEFPAVKEEDKNWKPVFVKNGPAACIGVYPQDSSSGSLPTLLFEQSRLKYLGQGAVLNSDYLNPGRILQYKAIPLSSNPINQPNRFICFSGTIKLDIADIHDYINKIQNEFVISNGKLKLVFDNGRLSLFFDNVPLTKANHMYSEFFTQHRWFTSDLASWTLKRESDSVLIARGSWDDLGVSQTWRINICGGRSFTWDVDIETKGNIAIEHQRLRCFFPPDYKVFFSKFVSERFTDIFNDAEVDLLQRCVPSGEAGLRDPTGRLPQLSLFFPEEAGNFLKVFNSDHYSKARLLHLEKVESEINVMLPAGKYECFRTRFVLDSGKTNDIDKLDNSIEDKVIRFLFNKGSGRFYKNGDELTKNIALYTSMRSKGRWHDSSSSALWKVIYKNSRQIKAVGRWLDLPLSQEWEVALKDDGLFEWTVSLEAEKEIEVDCLQANIMLSERFSHWLAGNEEGLFPGFRDDVDDNWDCLWIGKRDDRVISLREDPVYSLPRVSLSLKKSNPEWHLKVINSDKYHRGRILQYASSAQTNFLPGKYHYFSGFLTIQDK